MGPITKKRIAVDAVSWQAVCPDRACNSIALRNTAGVDLKLRSDAADPSTEDTLTPGAQEVYSPHPCHLGPMYAFQAGGPLLFAQLTSGTGTLVLTCIS